MPKSSVVIVEFVGNHIIIRGAVKWDSDLLLFDCCVGSVLGLEFCLFPVQFDI